MDELSSGRTLEDPLDAYRNVDRAPRRSPCWVAGHMVAGLDGTAAVDGRVGALSTTPDQLLFRRMRELADVVLVGSETVRREGYGPVRLDAPAQAARTALGMPPTPPLAIVTRSLDLDFSAAAFAEAPGHARTLVLTGENADRARRAAAAEAAEVVIAGREGVEPRAALGALADRGHRFVLCEGGPTWLGELVAANCLDELLLTISPVMGGDPLPVAVTPAGAGLEHFALRQVLAEEDTLFLRYEARRAGDG